MEKVKVAIIGAGRIGMLHAENILQSDLFELIAIADIFADEIDFSKYEDKIAFITNNPDEIFSRQDIDAVFICSSTNTHVEYIQKAALANKHIFCEKPISFRIEETIAALRLVNEQNVILQVGFNRRFDNHFHKVFNDIKAGVIGTPYLYKIISRDPEIPSEQYVKKSGGMFIDMTIHDFDMVRYLSQSEVVDITVKAANLIDPMFRKYDDVDTALIMMTLENGALAIIENSRRAIYGYDQRIEVFGEKGSIEALNESESNVKISLQEHVRFDVPKYFFLERYERAFKEEIKQFALSILENKQPLCSGNDGYQAQLLALAAKKSFQENRTVKLTELTYDKLVTI